MTNANSIYRKLLYVSQPIGFQAFSGRNWSIGKTTKSRQKRQRNAARCGHGTE